MIGEQGDPDFWSRKLNVSSKSFYPGVTYFPETERQRIGKS
jgi:hypothetical protein